jgi:hypothetical protein
MLRIPVIYISLKWESLANLFCRQEYISMLNLRVISRYGSTPLTYTRVGTNMPWAVLMFQAWLEGTR